MKGGRADGGSITCPSFLGGPFDHNMKRLANVAFWLSNSTPGNISPGKSEVGAKISLQGESSHYLQQQKKKEKETQAN